MATCGHCGYESEAPGVCPLCGHRLQDAEPPVEALGPPPWEDPSVGFPGNLAATWRDSLLAPARFFRTVPFEAPALRPLLYFLIVMLVSALFTLWWQTLGALPAELRRLLGAARSPPVWAAVEFFLTPFTALVLLVLSAGVFHLLALMLSPRHRGFGATLRVLCYAAGPGVLTVVPWVGGLVGGVWSLVLTIIGLREAHRTTSGRAAAIVLIPVAGLFLLILGLVVFAALVAGALGGGALGVG